MIVRETPSYTFPREGIARAAAFLNVSNTVAVKTNWGELTIKSEFNDKKVHMVSWGSGGVMEPFLSEPKF